MYSLGFIICSAVVVFVLLLSIVVSARVSHYYEENQKKLSSIDLTGQELAEKLSMDNHLGLNIKMCKGKMTDHYNPRNNSINISKANFDSKSISAQAVVAHEFGHALQHAEGYMPFKVRQAIVKVNNLVSKFILPIIILGIIFEFIVISTAGNIVNIVVYVYIGIYAIAVLANLVTLPVEFNASSRAKKILEEMGSGSEEEMKATSEVLNAAAMTYVASLALSMMYLIRILSIFWEPG